MSVDCWFVKKNDFIFISNGWQSLKPKNATFEENILLP